MPRHHERDSTPRGSRAGASLLEDFDSGHEMGEESRGKDVHRNCSRLSSRSIGIRA